MTYVQAISSLISDLGLSSTIFLVCLLFQIVIQSPGFYRHCLPKLMVFMLLSVFEILKDKHVPKSQATKFHDNSSNNK